MNFGEALKLVKGGGYLARRGWNGKDMFVFMGFPRVQLHTKAQNGVYEVAEASEVFGCDYNGPTLCMKTAQNDIVVGWLASQTDILSNDWNEINNPVKPEL